jgi:hypothetical protein
MYAWWMLLRDMSIYGARSDGNRAHVLVCPEPGVLACPIQHRRHCG